MCVKPEDYETGIQFWEWGVRTVRLLEDRLREDFEKKIILCTFIHISLQFLGSTHVLLFLCIESVNSSIIAF